MKIDVQNITVEYSGRKVLDVENLSFDKGRIYCVLGLNGSGKSTLLNCIAGMLDYRGKIVYNREDTIEDVRPQLSIMFQKPYMFNASVYDNIGCGLKFRKADKETIRRKISEYEKYFEIKDLMNKNAKSLSGGETSKVAMLRCAVLETEVVLLDEPTASMDIESRIKAEELIKSMASSNRTIILITHDFYQAERIADYIIFMDKGLVIEKGEKNRVLKNPEHSLVKALLNF